jgi:hypothetical protein
MAFARSELDSRGSNAEAQDEIRALKKELELYPCVPPSRGSGVPQVIDRHCPAETSKSRRETMAKRKRIKRSPKQRALAAQQKEWNSIGLPSKTRGVRLYSKAKVVSGGLPSLGKR